MKSNLPVFWGWEFKAVVSSLELRLGVKCNTRLPVFWGWEFKAVVSSLELRLGVKGNTRLLSWLLCVLTFQYKTCSSSKPQLIRWMLWFSNQTSFLWSLFQQLPLILVSCSSYKIFNILQANYKCSMQILVESQNQVLQLNDSTAMWEASYHQFSDMHNTKACCCAFLGHLFLCLSKLI